MPLVKGKFCYYGTPNNNFNNNNNDNKGGSSSRGGGTCPEKKHCEAD